MAVLDLFTFFFVALWHCFAYICICVLCLFVFISLTFALLPVCPLGPFNNPSMVRALLCLLHANRAAKGDWPGLRLSLRRCCLLTKQAARVLKRTAAARKQIVATTPATTGRASPSSGSSAGGKGSEGADKQVTWRVSDNSTPYLGRAFLCALLFL